MLTLYILCAFYFENFIRFAILHCKKSCLWKRKGKTLCTHHLKYFSLQISLDRNIDMHLFMNTKSFYKFVSIKLINTIYRGNKNFIMH